MKSDENATAPASPTCLWTNIFRSKAPTEASVREVLTTVPLFAGLTRKELSRVEDCLYLRRYRSDELIFRQGEPGLGMYVIHRGTVWIQRPKDAAGGEMEPILELARGDFFGEMALLEEHAHPVSARANGETELLGFFRPDLHTLIRYHPRLGNKLLLALARVMATRFRESLRTAEAL